MSADKFLARRAARERRREMLATSELARAGLRAAIMGAVDGGAHDVAAIASIVAARMPHVAATTLRRELARLVREDELERRGPDAFHRRSR